MSLNLSILIKTHGFHTNYTHICNLNRIPSFNLNHISLPKRTFTHYRFHKRVGKGNWNRYVERYTKPASIENTQPIYFNYKASYQSTKNSLSYLWDLPKKIALSTTSNQLLESWVYYRHKKKKLYHYVLALKRLSAFKDLDISDWRFKLIVNKVVKRSRYFTDLPTVCFYLGTLKCVDAIERVSYHLIERMEYYSPFQLGRIAHAFSACRLFNKYLFSLLAERFISFIEIAENDTISSVSKAFANCMVYNYKLFNAVSLEVQRRLTRDTIHTQERLLNRSHLMFAVNPSHSPPTLHNLVDLAESFSNAKYKDFAFFDSLSSLLSEHLKDPEFDPSIIAKAMTTYNRLKINDIPLIEEVLNQLHFKPYNFPPKHMSSILKDVSSMIPKTLTIYKEKFESLIEHLTTYLDSMNNKSLSEVAITAHKIGYSSPDLMERIRSNLVKNSKNDTSEYDPPKMFEVLSSKLTLDQASFDIFCYHTRKLLNKLEPCDFMRASRIMKRQNDESKTDVRLLNLMALRLREVEPEFKPYQFKAVVRNLRSSGFLQEGLLSDSVRS